MPQPSMTDPSWAAREPDLTVFVASCDERRSTPAGVGAPDRELCGLGTGLVEHTRLASHPWDENDMNIKLLGAFAAVSLLAACASTPPATTGATTGSGAAVSTNGPVPGSEEDLVANVGDRVFYAFNQSNLSSDAQSTLDRQSAWLARYPQVQVQIAGNCDDRGTEEYNLALGQRRANAARDYLVARGVQSARITTISYGKDRPTAQGDDEQAWAQNRNAITSVR
jgi:peptidoglycan-associated lipoprotein